MKAVTPFRVASVQLGIFAFLHTKGGMLAQKSLGPASDTVFEQMKQVHFNFNGADSTWYGFWFGFGITATLFLVLSAVLAWELDKVPAELWPRLRVIAWTLVASQIANDVIAWKYFFIGPGVFGVLISLLLITGILRKNATASAAIPRAA